MKSYLEVLWLTSTVCVYISWHLGEILTQKKHSKRKRIASAAMQALIGVMFQRWEMFLAGFVLFSFFLSGWHFLFWVESFLLYFVLIHLCGHFVMMEVFEMMLYADAASQSWIVLIVQLLFFDWLGEYKLRPMIKRSELLVLVSIKTRDTAFECIGFYDTGNFCMHEGKPVIFLRQSIPAELVLQVAGIGAKGVYPAAQAQIKLEGSVYDVFVASVSDLQVECLLHNSMR